LAVGSTVEESVDAKTLVQDDRFIRAVAKRVKELSSKATRERLSLLSLLAFILRKAGILK
jgi:hypothetical protein